MRELPGLTDCDHALARHRDETLALVLRARLLRRRSAELSALARWQARRARKRVLGLARLGKDEAAAKPVPRRRRSHARGEAALRLVRR